jgi:RNA polymerase sigma-70 factor (ECF subfamily)
MSTEPDSRERVAAAVAGDHEALAELFECHRGRLQRMIAARLDERLSARVNESDVLQDVFVEAQRRIGDFDPSHAPLFIWLRSLTGQRMIQLVRFHVDAEKRATGKEIPARAASPDASSDSLAGLFVSQLTSVSKAAVVAELRARIRSALEEIDDVDREILSLRYFEQLSNAEVAVSLGMNPSSSSTRHLRALRELKSKMIADPALADYLDQFGPFGKG